LDEIDRKLLALMEKGIALTPEPFSEIARELRISPSEVITRLTKLKDEGVIRKFGASIKPNNIGFSANALVAWKVPVDRVQEVGVQLSKLSDISHCYERKPVQGRWEYNLYTVMHARGRDSIQDTVNQISSGMAINEYKILYSTRDLKRTKFRTNNPDVIQSKASVMNSENPQEIDQL
jgi:DNA-binding Lrp family transcriptional regulator